MYVNEGLTMNVVSDIAVTINNANDAGLITAKELLPMTGVFYGPLLYDSQNATFTVGRLRCTGS